MTRRVTISDVAPRDGLQPIGPFVPTETKVALVRALYEAGVRRMEVGSFVSPKAIPQMADTGDVLKAALMLDGLESTVLVPNRKGYELAKAAGAHRVGLFMSVTEAHNQSNLNRSRAESFADLSAIVREATAAGVKIRFNLSCCFHCPFEGVVPDRDALDWVERAVALDPVMEVAICDTTGNAAPDQVARVVGHAVKAWTAPDGSNRIAFHGHDTYGMGVANVAAAWGVGFDEDATERELRMGLTPNWIICTVGQV